MIDLDVNQILEKFSEDNPSGDDLEYDPDFIELEAASQGKPEQQYGDTIIPAEPPDWKSVSLHAVNILKRSHDLRAATHLSNSSLVQEGMVAFTEVIGLIKGMVTEHWPTMHPQLDPDDDNDPTIRVNTLMSLCDSATTMNFLMHTPLVEVRTIGSFSLFDCRVAHGELSWPADSDSAPPEKNLIEAAFQDCELEQLAAKSSASAELLGYLKEIEDFVTDQVGAAESCNFEKLVKEVKAIQHILDEQLSKRTPDAPPEVEQEADDEAESSSTPTAGNSGTPAKGFQNIHDLVVKTRQEAIVALDKICEYFERYEPSSPLPLLLKRARRLSTKSFLEIIRDISPDGIHQVESLGGLDDNSEGLNEESPADYGNSVSPPISNNDGDSY